jgi:signal transduction histidine kinase
MTFENPIKVLCIDDLPEMCGMLKSYLESDGIEVETATSVTKAKELLKQNFFEVIISDYQMPEKNGMEFLKELREENNQIIFVFCTARSCERLAIEALNNGADLFISKDGDLGERFKLLLVEIKKLVARQRQETQLKENLRKSEEKYRLIVEKLMILGSITRHDISNKLTIIIGFLDLMRGSDLSESSKKWLERMDAAAKEIRKQIKFAENYEKLGSMQPTWQIVAELIPSPESKQIALEKNCLGLRVYADPMLAKVFGNLMANTILHGVRTTEINVRHEVRDEGVIIVWEDNGVGIPDNEKEKIFERGFGKNTGLGLFLIREILAITGMTICETGVPGKGARFEIFVPREKYIIRGGD